MLIYMFKWNAFVFSFTFTTITFHPKYGLLLLKKYRFRSVMLNDCKSMGVRYGPYTEDSHIRAIYNSNDLNCLKTAIDKRAGSTLSLSARHIVRRG